MPMVGSEGGMPPGASPYYQRSHQPSPYGRPYMGAQAGGYGHSPNDLAAAGIYARQAARAYGYGVPPSGTSPDQRGYPHPPPYGMPPGSEGYAGYGYPPRDMYGQRPPDVGHPHHNPYQSPPNAPSPKGASPGSRATPPGIPGSGGSKGQSGDAEDDEEHHHHENNESGSGSDEEEEEDHDENPDSQKWFHGSVPLGLEDDKYWLSELQVYLRANFAEAFGATEEDIAGKN